MQEQKKLEEMSVDELMVLAYKVLRNIEQGQNYLRAVNSEIEKKERGVLQPPNASTQTPKRQYKKKDKPDKNGVLGEDEKE